MSPVDPAPVTPAVADDPKRPYKAILTGVFLFLGTLWAQLQGVEDWGSLGVQDWLTILIPTILGTAAVYLVPNPKVAVLNARRRVGERGYGAVEVALVVLLVVVALVILLRFLG